jgi:hypothetical protein
VVHVFTPRLRAFYDLERLWGGAARMEIRPSSPAPRAASSLPGRGR